MGSISFFLLHLKGLKLAEFSFTFLDFTFGFCWNHLEFSLERGRCSFNLSHFSNLAGTGTGWTWAGTFFVHWLGLSLKGGHFLFPLSRGLKDFLRPRLLTSGWQSSFQRLYSMFDPQYMTISSVKISRPFSAPQNVGTERATFFKWVHSRPPQWFSCNQCHWFSLSSSAVFRPIQSCKTFFMCGLT